MIAWGKHSFEPTMFKYWSREKFLDRFNYVQDISNLWELICKANDIQEIDELDKSENVRGRKKQTKHPNPFKSK